MQPRWLKIGDCRCEAFVSSDASLSHVRRAAERRQQQLILVFFRILAKLSHTAEIVALLAVNTDSLQVPYGLCRLR